MSLNDVEIQNTGDAIPSDVEAFIREAELRMDGYFARHPKLRVPRFIPSDARKAYRALRSIREHALAPGSCFCEWGSGFGVITSLSAMLDFDACGIEIEDSLVDEANKLAADFSVDVRFVCDSYIPNGFEYVTDGIGNTSALSRSAVLPSERFRGQDPFHNEIEIEDFDVTYTFPWPGETELIANLFDARAAAGALLITYDEQDGVIVQRRSPGSFHPDPIGAPRIPFA